MCEYSMHICTRFCHVFRSPPPIMEVAFGRPHNGGRAAFGRPPTVVVTIMGDGEAENIAKTYIQICIKYLRICISVQFSNIPLIGSLELFK